MPVPVTPKLCVDIIIVVKLFGRRNAGIVLIERKNRPFGWALPGGFVDVGETLEAAATREAKEETGLRLKRLRQFACYSHPRRDPRGHSVACVFTAEAEGLPRGGDDASQACSFDPRRLPARVCFDHRKIIADWRKSKGGRGKR